MLYRGEHPFIFQKKAIAVLPNKVVIEKMAHINSGLVLISAPNTAIEQLEEYKKTLTQVFRVCCAE